MPAAAEGPPAAGTLLDWGCNGALLACGSAWRGPGRSGSWHPEVTQVAVKLMA